MTEVEYISALRARWPREFSGRLSPETLRLADEAVHAFPDCAMLWDMRVDLIRLGEGDTPHTLEDALVSYRKAVEVDPAFAPGWKLIGHFYDVHHDDGKTAHRYFKHAARLQRSGVA